MTEEQEQKPAVEKNPHIYKPAYTKQEVDELTRWFEERMDRLPATLQLNEATAASDLPRTVKALLAVLKVHKENIRDFQWIYVPSGLDSFAVERTRSGVNRKRGKTDEKADTDNMGGRFVPLSGTGIAGRVGRLAGTVAAYGGGQEGASRNSRHSGREGHADGEQ